MGPGVCQAEEATSIPQPCPLQEAKALDTKGRLGHPGMPHVLHRWLGLLHVKDTCCLETG